MGVTLGCLLYTSIQADVTDGAGETQHANLSLPLGSTSMVLHMDNLPDNLVKEKKLEIQPVSYTHLDVYKRQVFGVFSHIFRGWRWTLTLAPLGAHPKTSDCVYAIFVS